MEFPATGGCIPSASFRTVKLLRYVRPLDFFVLACEVIFILFILYYSIEEVIEVRTGLWTSSRIKCLSFQKLYTCWSFKTFVCDFFRENHRTILTEFLFKQIRKHKLSYFKSIWNWLDIIVIAISIICTIFNVYRTVSVGSKLKTLLEDENKYPDFDFLSYWQQHFNYAVAITVFLAWIKVKIVSIYFFRFFCQVSITKKT